MGQFSDEATYCMECVTKHDPTMRRYSLAGEEIKALASTMSGEAREEALICDPGKFEGEPLAAYHAYHVMMDGFADDDDGPAWRVGNVICEESEQGFVYCTIFDTEEEAIAHWAETEPEYVEEYA